MSGFSADWLALRAAADRRARDPGLARRLGEVFEGRARIRVLDIGAGTGANLRATAPLIGAAQHWVLVDNDPSLMGQVTAPERITFDTCVTDLAGNLEALFDPAPDLVTASAFFDLCGADWLDRFLALVAGSGAAFYTVLTYDGRETWTPAHPLDAEVLAAFHADQRRDKGLGPALGPDAPEALAAMLGAAGCEVQAAPSDWHLTQSGDAALIEALAAGSAAAVAPILGRDRAEDWADARRHAEAVLIGHQDLLALPRA